MILCIGTTPTVQRSMVFERVVWDEVNRAREVSEYASGKSVNVARVLATLDKEAVCTGFVGGARGEVIRRDLDRIGVRHEFVGVGAQTRLCTTVIDRAKGEATELVEESSPVEEGCWGELDEKVGRLGRDAKVWVMSGSLPPGGDEGAYSRWAEMGRKAGADVIVDGRGEAARRAIRHEGVILKLNREELAATVGMAIGSEGELMEAMRQAGCRRVVVTMGGEGSIAYDGGRAWRVRTPAVEVVSPIGSGDAFAAGLAAGLLTGHTLSDAAKLAGACGAANAMTALAGHVRKADVRRILGQTIVEAV